MSPIHLGHSVYKMHKKAVVSPDVVVVNFFAIYFSKNFFVRLFRKNLRSENKEKVCLSIGHNFSAIIFLLLQYKLILLSTQYNISQPYLKIFERAIFFGHINSITNVYVIYFYEFTLALSGLCTYMAIW